MLTRLPIAAATAATFVLISTTVDAGTANVPFTAAVISTCTLTVGTPGVMTPNGDYTVLGSKQAGGISGSVTAVSTGTTFNVSVDAPTAFSVAPVGGNNNVSFSAAYSANGATNVGQTLGAVTTLLNAGLTTLSVDLTATKSTGVFTQGAYTTEAVVRCE